MVNVAPTPRADVFGELRQIGAVRLDGVRRGIALLQRTKELRHSFLDDGGCALPHRASKGRTFRCAVASLHFFSSRADFSRRGTRSPFAPRMMLLVHAIQPVEREMGVNLGRRNVGVAEDGLHRAPKSGVL